MTYHKIFCPFCMERYLPNNVVFQLPQEEGKVVKLDPYLRNFKINYLGAKPEEDDFRDCYRYGVADPAYLSEKEKDYIEVDGARILYKLKRGAGKLSLQTRLCPYCHNALVSQAGLMSVNVLSVLGHQGSGKTTFEAALIDGLNSIGLNTKNISLTADGSQKLETVEDNINKLLNGSQWSDTSDKEGPFHYSIPLNSGDCLLSMVDLPGEWFVNDKLLERDGKAIPESNTWILLVDPDKPDAARKAFNNVWDKYQKELSSGSIHIALVIHKADKLEVGDVDPVCMRVRDYKGCKPIDMDGIELNHRDILKLLEKKGLTPLLNLYKDIEKKYGGKVHCRFFATSCMRDNQYVRRNNVVEPLLWSWTLSGLYP